MDQIEEPTTEVSNEPATEVEDNKPEQDEVARWKSIARKWETQSRANHSELEKLKAQGTLPDDYEALKEENRSFKIATISSKYALPARVIQMLEGDTLEELEADAKKWAEDLNLAGVDKDADDVKEEEPSKAEETTQETSPAEELKAKLMLHLQGRKSDTSNTGKIKTLDDLEKHINSIKNN